MVPKIAKHTTKHPLFRNQCKAIGTITANGKKQWLDHFGIIKANSENIDENVTIPSGTNGLSVGTIRVGAGYSVTIKGNWRIV